MDGRLRRSVACRLTPHVKISWTVRQNTLPLLPSSPPRSNANLFFSFTGYKLCGWDATNSVTRDVAAVTTPQSASPTVRQRVGGDRSRSNWSGDRGQRFRYKQLQDVCGCSGTAASRSAGSPYVSAATPVLCVVAAGRGRSDRRSLASRTAATEVVSIEPTRDVGSRKRFQHLPHVDSLSGVASHITTHVHFHENSVSTIEVMRCFEIQVSLARNQVCTSRPGEKSTSCTATHGWRCCSLRDNCDSHGKTGFGSSQNSPQRTTYNRQSFYS